MADYRISPTRAAIVAHARTWIGTPYHHQASCIGIGTDCLGLIRGIFRSLYGHEAESIPGYARDWAEGAGEETMLAAARRHLVEIAPSAAEPGDVLIFRYRQRYMAKHAALLPAPPSSTPSKARP
jgi:NlpC/P60 family putative phage cell wall peptidase